MTYSYSYPYSYSTELVQPGVIQLIMTYLILPNVDVAISIILLIAAALVSLKHRLTDASNIALYSQLLVVYMYACDHISGSIAITPVAFLYGIMCLITVCILHTLSTSIESILLLLLSYIGMITFSQSIELISLYISMELTSFAFIVLVAIAPNNDRNHHATESALKYGIISAFSSSIILYSVSLSYMNTGTLDVSLNNPIVITALLLKLGIGPMHYWLVELYTSTKPSLVLFIATLPKSALYAFWLNSYHGAVNTPGVKGFLVSELVDQLGYLEPLNPRSNYIGIYAFISLVIGSIGAYNNPKLRGLIAYSSIAEVSLLVLGLSTASLHAVVLQFTIYCLTQLLLWSTHNKQSLILTAVSLAGLPPLLGFFGKAWVISYIALSSNMLMLSIALIAAVMSVVYYIRFIRIMYTTVDYKQSLVSATPIRYMLNTMVSLILVYGSIFALKPLVL